MSMPTTYRQHITTLRKLIVLALVGVAGGCTVGGPSEPPPLDLSPVSCGHKWVQTAHSPKTRHRCADDTVPLLARLEGTTTETLWDAARIRCPAECRPIEISDPFNDYQAEFTDCKNDQVYLRVTKMLHCRH